MRSSNRVLLDLAVRHALLVERFKAHEVRRLVKILDREVLPDLTAMLAGRLENIKTRGYDTGPDTTERLKFLYRDVTAVFASLESLLRAEIEQSAISLAQQQATQLVKDISREAGVQVSVVFPSDAMLRKAVLSRIVSGFTVKDRILKQSSSMRQAVEAQVRIGIFEGEPAQKIIRRVKAIWPTQRRRVANLVTKTIAHAQNQARQATYERNADLLSGVQWNATLDISTCPVCGDLDGEVFEVDEGPRPPEHSWCRCTTTPILRSARELGGTRASMDGQVPARLTWAEWVEDQPVERQDAIFGRGVARLFRAGRIELGDMVDGAGRVLSLADLTRLANSL